MKEVVKNLYRHPLFSGSAIMIVGTNFANFVAYFYHLVFGRLLGPSLYGDLATVISIVSFFFAFISFFGLVIVKFVSSNYEKKQRIFYSILYRKYSLFVLLLSFFVLISTFFLSSRLKISISVLAWIAPAVFFMFLAMIQGSFLQGKLKFGQSVSLNVLGVLFRFLFGLAFYYLGFSLAGISAGITLSYIVVWLEGKKMLGFKIGKIKSDHVLGKDIMKYSIPVFVATTGMSAFITIDIVLVKYFFDAYYSGLYASLSTLGKIIFYGAIPVSYVMFPLVSKRFANKRKTGKIFLLSLLMASTIGLGILFIYYLIPDLAVGFLFGGKYLEGASYLVLFGVFSFLFTIDYLVVNYYLSLGKVFVSYIVPIGVVGQVVAIVLLHNTFAGVIWASIIATFGLLILLTLYGIFMNRKQFSISSSEARK